MKTRIVAGAAVVALAAAGCGSKSTPSSAGTGATTTSSAAGTTSAATSAASATTSAAAAAFHACMVTDTGGIDDKSFNASAWAGMQAAQTDGKAKVDYVQSTSENDYVPNITKLIGEKCDLIVTVGGLMGNATDQAAKANPTQKFAIVDDGAVDNTDFKTVYNNIHGLQFNTAQGAFLAGYAAAGTSKTGTVGTWGGLNIPPVTVYMDGFWEGVQYYNKQKGKSVKVLGWDEGNQKGGSFAGSFTDTNKGKSLTDGMVNQGADIIFPVAGGAGNGATASAKASGGKVSVIWVDTDGCTSDAADCPVFLGSVTKGIALAVQQVVEDAAGGTYKGGVSTNLDLSTKGTAFVPGSQIGSQIPAAVTTDLTQITADIASGKIKITSPSQPQ